MQPELREQTQGRWPDIYRAFGLADEQFLSNRNIPCPDCGGKDRFRFVDYDRGFVICNQCMAEGMDGIDYLMHRTKQDFKTVADEVRQIIGNAQISSKPEVDIEKRKASLQKVWVESVDITDGDPVHRYFESRGLTVPNCSDIRLHRSLPYFEKNGNDWARLGNHPAMISKVRDFEGAPATMHCTYLTEDGQKADLATCRKIKPPCRSWKGGAVRLSSLHEIGGSIVVAEGIETTAAFMQHEGLQGWAALSAGNLEAFIPPPDVFVIIAADNDKNAAGQLAAFSLMKRLHSEGVKCDVQIPPNYGDWAEEFAA